MITIRRVSTIFAAAMGLSGAACAVGEPSATPPALQMAPSLTFSNRLAQHDLGDASG